MPNTSKIILHHGFEYDKNKTPSIMISLFHWSEKYGYFLLTSNTVQIFKATKISSSNAFSELRRTSSKIRKKVHFGNFVVHVHCLS